MWLRDVCGYQVKGCLVPEFDSEKGLTQPTSFSISFNANSPDWGTFMLAPLPGCCGVVVSTNSYIIPARRGQQFGKDFHKIKEEVARMFGYTVMLSTIQNRNIPELVGACKAKWKVVHSFRNKRTTNDIAIAIKEI